MAPLPSQVTGDAYTSEFGWNILTELAEIENRMAGHEGERRAAEIMTDAFGSIGARNVTTSEFEIQGWGRKTSSITVAETGRTYRPRDGVLALPMSRPGEVQGSLCDVGYGTEAEFEGSDFEGAVVLVSADSPDDSPWIHRNEKYARAVEGGAVGFVFCNHIDGNLPPTGSVGLGLGVLSEIPAIGISKEVGEALRRRAEHGCELEVKVDCETPTTTSRNVEAVIGPDVGPEVLVSAHMDGHDIGEAAADNALGSALVAEIGRILTAVESDLDVRVRLVAFGAEELGIIGSERYAQRKTQDEIKAVVNIDTAGTGRTLKLKTSGFDVFEDAYEAAASELSVPVEFLTEVIPDSDHWPFVHRGIPAATANSVHEDRDRGWGHTHGDTLDKLDARDFREMALILSAGVVKIASENVSARHHSPEEVRDRMAPNYLDELRITDQWPW